MLNRRSFIKGALGVGVVVGGVSLTNLVFANKAVALSGKTMGTYWSVLLAANLSSKQISGLQMQIDDLLQRINQSMSTYIPDSELMRFNQFPADKIFPLSDDLFKVIRSALEVSKKTNGLYDITVGPLVNIWGFGPKKINKLPDQKTIQTTLERVGYQKLQLHPNGLLKTQSDLFVDLSSIAKGFAVDEVASLLQKQGFDDILVEIGGELRAEGSKFGKPWRIGLERPQKDRRELQNIVELQGRLRAMATSGNYRNFINKNGIDAAHIINPKTGYTEHSNLLSATVLYQNCMMADSYATALMVLGEKGALSFANQHNLAVELILAKNNKFQVVRNEIFDQALIK